MLCKWLEKGMHKSRSQHHWKVRKVSHHWNEIGVKGCLNRSWKTNNMIKSVWYRWQDDIDHVAWSNWNLIWTWQRHVMWHDNQLFYGDQKSLDGKIFKKKHTLTTMSIVMDEITKIFSNNHDIWMSLPYF